MARRIFISNEMNGLALEVRSSISATSGLLAFPFAIQARVFANGGGSRAGRLTAEVVPVVFNPAELAAHVAFALAALASALAALGDGVDGHGQEALVRPGEGNVWFWASHLHDEYLELCKREHEDASPLTMAAPPSPGRAPLRCSRWE